MNKKRQLKSTILAIITLLVVFTLTFIPVHQAQAIDEVATSETRVILSFDSNADKQEFLTTLESQTALNSKQEVTSSINSLLSSNNEIVDQSNIVNEDFGELPIVTLDVTPQEIATLVQQLSDVEIAPVRRKQLFLSSSVPLINATRVWQIQQTLQPSLALENITGYSQSACIIDTGIKANHVDFSGKFIVQKCFCALQPGNRAANCCPNGQNEDTNASDSNGHGTHVAGIVAANGLVKGVAPNANIVAVKVFGADGYAYDDDLIKAIQYCTNNSETYNISVISMSLGGGTYTNLCPSDALEPAISAALVKNISVVVATGNDGYSNAIASPACVPGVTRVAASNNTDGLAEDFSNTNNYVSLVAPGVDIISTYNTGGYAQLDGTSMATPHVSGAVLLLRQVLTNSNTSQNTSQIESVLNSTGKQIYSSIRTRNFSRINVYDAISSLATSNISFSSTTQNSSENITHSYIIISVSENSFLLSSINISIYNSSQQKIWIENGTTSPLYFNFTAQVDDIYYFNATSKNAIGITNYTQTRLVTIDTTTPTINYFSPTPTDNTTITNSSFTVNVSANDTNLRFINISIYNSSNNLVWRENSTTSPISFTYNATIDQIYFYNATATDWVGWTNSTQTRNITINANAPILLNYSFRYISNESALLLTTSDTLGNATLSYGINDSLMNLYYNQTVSLNHEFMLTNLTNSTIYFFNISFTDVSLNNMTNGTFNFTTQATFVVLNESEWLTNETTDFSQYNVTQLQNMTNVSFANYQGTISFVENINITTPLNLTDAIRITQHKIVVNTTLIPEFNHAANLTFRNVTLTHPIVKRNNIDCNASNGNCSNQAFNATENAYVVRVSMFSVYDLVEQCTDSIQNYDETGTDCGGANCNSCPPSSGGSSGSAGGSRGGGGGIMPTPIRKLNLTNTTNTSIANFSNNSPGFEQTPQINPSNAKNNEQLSGNNSNYIAPALINDAANNKKNASFTQGLVIAILILIAGSLAVFNLKR